MGIILNRSIEDVCIKRNNNSGIYSICAKAMRGFLLIVLFSSLNVLGYSATTDNKVSNTEYSISEVIKGKVIDSSTGETLPGANVKIKDTLIGDAADGEGEFIISGANTGSITLVVSYLGFVTKEINIEVVEGGDNYFVIELDPLVISGQEVVISVQAQGQREAINQQKTSNTAKNVVSSTKIQELPEANAAEAVGRLPGVSLQRQGGEGNKVVIRGLSPRFNKIAVEGVSLSSTDNQDRSTDLSMISSFMLDGIEVTKAALANQEADQLGGTVNFKLKSAPEEAVFNSILQGGYNNLTEEAQDYKVVLSGGQRFLKKKFGIYANLDIESINRSDNSAIANYQIQQLPAFNDTLAIPNNVSFQRNTRRNDRFGASAVLDYKLPNTSLKLFGMFNHLNTDNIFQQESIFGGSGDYQLIVNDTQTELTVGTTSFEVEHWFNRLKVTGGASYNFSRREIPDGIQMTVVDRNNVTLASELVELNGRRGVIIDSESGTGYLHPDEWPALINDISQANVDQILKFNQELFQNQITADLKLEHSFNIGNFIILDIEVGGKFKRTSRRFDVNQNRHQFFFSANTDVSNIWYQEVLRRGEEEFLLGWTPTTIGFPFGVFEDNSFSSNDFYNGQLSTVLSADMARIFMDLLPLTDQGNNIGLQIDYVASELGDYDGNEDYYATYILPTFKIGKSLILIPGFRYELNKTTYTGIRAAGVGLWSNPFTATEFTADRENDFLLPMLHFRYNVSSTFDIRGSYTETISRPNFNLLAPSWNNPNVNSLSWNDPSLKPLEANNYDLTFSFYTNKIGLISVSGFYKSISNFIYPDVSYIVDEEQLREEFPEDLTPVATVSGFINNPNDATLYGTELEWQSNFWFLPGALKGLVFGINYTYTFSETIYPSTKAIRGGISQGFRIIGSEDISYKARLIDQPDHTLNTTLGFDYKDFSIRGSLRYKDGIFSQTAFEPELRSETDGLVLFDLSISQKISAAPGLSLFLNAANLGESTDQVTNDGRGWYSNQNFYGLTGQLGLRYRL